MLLANLLRTLSAEEIQKIRTDFQMAERSRMLFERIVLSAQSPVDSRSLAKAFRISPENLYRLFSEIVDECVRILAPKGDFSTLEFFRTKYLYRPFVTEMHRTEKSLLKQNDRAALEQYYEYLFVNIPSFPISVIDLELMEKIGEKWYSSQLHPRADVDLYIRLRIIFMRIASLPSRKKMNLQQMSDYSRSLLHHLSLRAESSDNPLVRYQYYQCEWKACIYERSNEKVQVAWLKKSLQVIYEHKSEFEPTLEQFIRVQIAYESALHCNEVEEGLAFFNSVYESKNRNPIGTLFHIWYIRVAILARDFSTAEKILSEFEQHQIVKVTPAIYITVLVIRSELELIGQRYSAAAKSIDAAKATNEGNFFLAYEVQIRGLEAALALKTGNHELAEQLSERNIKWLRSRRISLSTSAWTYYYQIIAALVRSRMTGEAIRPGLMQHFTTDFKREHPEFFILIEPEIQKLTSDSKL